MVHDLGGARAAGHAVPGVRLGVLPPGDDVLPQPRLQRRRARRDRAAPSYTDARYQPPPPYIPRHAEGEDYQPFALAAVELDGEGIVVLGQVADGFGVDDLTIGAEVELVVEPLHTDAATDTTYLTWRWRPTS
jgi:hypothetical protein